MKTKNRANINPEAKIEQGKKESSIRTTDLDRSASYYKQLSEKQLTESSHLAEQLICLRSDLEREHLQVMKYRKQGQSYYSEQASVDKTPRSRTMPKNGIRSSGGIAKTTSMEDEAPEPQSARPKPYVMSVEGTKCPSPFLGADDSLSYGDSKMSNKICAKTKKRPRLDPQKMPYKFIAHSHKGDNK